MWQECSGHAPTLPPLPSKKAANAALLLGKGVVPISHGDAPAGAPTDAPAAHSCRILFHSQNYSMGTRSSGTVTPSAEATSALYFGVMLSETYAIGISAGFAPFTRMSYAISPAFCPIS